MDTPSTARARYGMTALFALSLILWILAGPEDSQRLYYAVIDLIAAAIVFTSALSTIGDKHFRVASVIVTVLCATSVIAPIIASPTVARVSTFIALLIVSIYVPIVIVRGLRTRQRVDVQLVLAAVTIYLLIGMISAVAFSFAGLLEGDPLLHIAGTASNEAASGDGTFRERVYLSFVTLATVGYGDVTPANGTARAIAMLTALVGQLYLVVAVATAVTMVASERGSLADPRTGAPE